MDRAVHRVEMEICIPLDRQETGTHADLSPIPKQLDGGGVDEHSQADPPVCRRQRGRAPETRYLLPGAQNCEVVQTDLTTGTLAHLDFCLHVKVIAVRSQAKVFPGIQLLVGKGMILKI